MQGSLLFGKVGISLVSSANSTRQSDVAFSASKKRPSAVI